MSRALFRRQRRTTPWLALGGLSSFALLALGFAHPPVSTLDAELGQALFAWRDGALAQACVALARLFDGLGHAPVQAAWVVLIAVLLASLGAGCLWLLSVLVLLFFLRDLRATAVIAVSIPISLLATFVPLQLLAYHTACAKGTDVDKPRNLAKSVTVE